MNGAHGLFGHGLGRRRTWWRRLVRPRLVLGVAGVVALIAVADLLGALHGRSAGDGADAGAASPLIGRHAPALSGPTVAGTDYRWRPGHVTVVNIWASWCGPCRDELPLIARFARTSSPQGVRVVTIDSRDGIDPAKEFLAKVGARHLLAIHDPNGRLAVSWGATGIPETFVVDAHGVIRAHRIGEVDAAWLTDEVGRWT
ncbi:TlpA family protein disulfide reductase [Nocardioides sp. DS6]|uniref:TlpA family protein disulfide reductase n=1 Tax=Nocardioides eburneus TaxID=3231482 RepID=A0ABV3T2F4_9ACTN